MSVSRWLCICVVYIDSYLICIHVLQYITYICVS